MALIAELVAPRPEAAGQAVQAVLVSEADGAMHLMGDLGDLAGSLAGADLRCGDRERRRGPVRCGSNGGALDRDRGSRLFDEQRQLLLDGLELGDRPPELQV